MSKYFSHRRTLTIPGIVRKAIAPPADFVITSNDIHTGIAVPPLLPMNVNSNIIIHGVGIYCNFADGLVFKYPRGGRLWAAVDIVGGRLQTPQPTGTQYDIAADDNVITGTLTDFTPTVDPTDIVTMNGEPGYVGSVPDNVTINLTNLTRAAKVAQPLSNLLVYDSTYTDGDRYYDIPSFNTIYQNNSFVNSLSLIPPGGTVFDKYFIVANLVFEPTGFTQWEFLTKSIDTAFAGDNLLLDIVVDIEYSPLANAT